MESKLKLFTDNQKDFLKYLKSRFPLYHDSNVFFRDLHYGVMSYLDINKVRYSYTEAEAVTRAVVEALETATILRRIDRQTWMLNYPEFKKPSSKPAPPAKPTASAAATPGAAKPAVKPAAAPASAHPQAAAQPSSPAPAESRENPAESASGA
jgi:hypothetical protein